MVEERATVNELRTYVIRLAMFSHERARSLALLDYFEEREAYIARLERALARATLSEAGAAPAAPPASGREPWQTALVADREPTDAERAYGASLEPIASEVLERNREAPETPVAILAEPAPGVASASAEGGREEEV